jgi:hypothetical protein
MYHGKTEMSTAATSPIPKSHISRQMAYSRSVVSPRRWSWRCGCWRWAKAEAEADMAEARGRSLRKGNCRLVCDANLKGSNKMQKIKSCAEGCPMPDEGWTKIERNVPLTENGTPRFFFK